MSDPCQESGRVATRSPSASPRYGVVKTSSDVRVECPSGKVGLRRAAEAAFRHEPDTEFGAVGGVILERGEAVFVQLGAAAVDRRIVFVPVGDRVAVGAAGREDGLPEAFDGLGVGLAGKDLARPCRAGDAGDAPLVAVFGRLAERLDGGEARGLRAGAFALIDARHAVGVVGIEPEQCGQAFGAPFPARDLPAGDLRQRRFILINAVQFVERHVVPVHDHAGSARLIALFDDVADERRLLEIGDEQHFLSPVEVQTFFHDQIGVSVEAGFLHDGSRPFS